jgi:hypothetical protein
MSGGVCEPRHDNGSTEHHAVVFQLFFFFLRVKLGDSFTTTHGKLQQAFGDDATSRAQAFRWHNMTSEGIISIRHSRRK